MIVVAAKDTGLAGSIATRIAAKAENACALLEVGDDPAGNARAPASSATATSRSIGRTKPDRGNRQEC